MEAEADLYAQKNSGLNNPKDNRYGRYYRAFIAGYQEAIRKADQLLSEAEYLNKISANGELAESGEAFLKRLAEFRSKLQVDSSQRNLK